MTITGPKRKNTAIKKNNIKKKNTVGNQSISFDSILSTVKNHPPVRIYLPLLKGYVRVKPPSSLFLKKLQEAQTNIVDYAELLALFLAENLMNDELQVIADHSTWMQLTPDQLISFFDALSEGIDLSRDVKVVSKIN